MDLAVPFDSRSKLRAVGAAGGLGLGAIAVSFALVGAVGLLVSATGVSIGVLVAIVLTLVLTQGVTFGGVALGYLSWRGWSREDVGVRLPSLLEVAIAVAGWLLAIGFLMVAGMVVQMLDAPTARNQIAEVSARNPEVLLLLIPGSFVLIGPGEELLYRGVVQNRLREAFSAPAAVTIAAALFAGIHYLALTGSATGRLVTLVILFFPSLLFGAAYEYTENLVVPALIHGAYNATLFTVLYVTLKFGAEMGA